MSFQLDHASRRQLGYKLIDLINDFEFEAPEEAEALFKHALPMAQRIAALKRRAKQAAGANPCGR